MILINLFLISLIGVGVFFYCNKNIERAIYAGVINERLTMYDFVISNKYKDMEIYLENTIKANIDIVYHDKKLRTLSKQMHFCEKISYIKASLLQDGVPLNKLQEICPNLKGNGIKRIRIKGIKGYGDNDNPSTTK